MIKEWTKQELDLAIAMQGSGMSYAEIAEELGRTYNSVSIRIGRAKKDGHIKESQLPPSRMPLIDKPLRSEGDAVVLTDVEAPFQHSEFINRVLDLADAWGVQDIHMAGDLLHYDNLSKWGSEWTEDKESMADAILEIMDMVKPKERDKARALLEARGILQDDGLSGELSEARKVFASISSFKNIYVALGNHDDRYLRAIDKALSPSELLHQLDRHNDKRWKIAQYYYTLIDTEQGQFRAEHPRGSGKNAAVDLAIQYHCHIIMGHSHRWAVNRDPSGKYWAIQTGHCVDETRLKYVQQRSAKRDAHVLGATIVRGGFPFVLCPETPWEIMKRM